MSAERLDLYLESPPPKTMQNPVLGWCGQQRTGEVSLCWKPMGVNVVRIEPVIAEPEPGPAQEWTVTEVGQPASQKEPSTIIWAGGLIGLIVLIVVLVRHFWKKIDGEDLGG